jgi:hypothetical protein
LTSIAHRARTSALVSGWGSSVSVVAITPLRHFLTYLTYLTSVISSMRDIL